MEAVSRTDFHVVPLITIHGRREPTVANVTQIVMPNEIGLIEHWSENRRSSMNELLNSALVANLPKTRVFQAECAKSIQFTETFDFRCRAKREQNSREFGIAPSFSDNAAGRAVLI